MTMQSLLGLVPPEAPQSHRSHRPPRGLLRKLLPGLLVLGAAVTVLLVAVPLLGLLLSAALSGLLLMLAGLALMAPLALVAATLLRVLAGMRHP